MDIGGLYDCLLGIYEGKADPKILEKYSEIRRQKYQELTDPISQDNIRRLFDQDPDQALEKDDFLKLLKRNEGDAAAQREFLLSPNALKYDFTQHYKKAAAEMKTHDVKEASVHVERLPGLEAA